LDPSHRNKSDATPHLLDKYLHLVPHENEIRSILRRWKPHRLLVDLGAGLGQYSIFFSRRGWRVISVDIAWSRLKKLQQTLQDKYPDLNIFLVQARAEALPFKQHAVDYIFTHSVLIHTDISQSFPEIARTMKREGTCIEPTLYNPFVRLYRRFLAPRQWKEITGYFSRHTIQQMKSSFSGSSMAIHVHPHHILNFFSYFWFYSWCQPFLFKVFNRIFSALDIFLFRIFSLQWFWMYEIQIRRKK